MSQTLYLCFFHMQIRKNIHVLASESLFTDTTSDNEIAIRIFVWFTLNCRHNQEEMTIEVKKRLLNQNTQNRLARLSHMCRDDIKAPSRLYSPSNDTDVTAFSS